MDSIYKALLDAGCELDNHESDLYVKASPIAEMLIRAYPCNASRFTSNIDGSLWWDIPFAYDPFWQAKARSI